MPTALSADASSVGVIGEFSGNFTKALYLRSQTSDELERRLGYGPGRLAHGWWLLFALEKPSPDNFEFGGYTYLSGSRIGDPKLGDVRPHVEQDLARMMGSRAAVQAHKKQHIEGLQISGFERLAKVIPVDRGTDYPIGTGIYQCNIPRPISCRVADFVPAGGRYLKLYE